jgi:hypothetical protein
MADRCAITDRSDPAYVPSECIMHFVRAGRNDNSQAGFERIYPALMARVIRALPRSESADGQLVSAKQSEINDKVFHRLQALLSADRNEYSDKLDYFEIRFDGGLASLRRDAQETVWQEENRKTPLESRETGELSAEVEKAVGSYNPFENSEIDENDYRSRLDKAIEKLPREQIRIIEMLRLEIPIDSKDQTVHTIAKALGRSEKTIRTHRDKALATLKALLLGEDK